MSTIVNCICHVGRLEQHHNSNMLLTYVATIKLNKLARRYKKILILKRSKVKYANKLEMKKVWKQLKRNSMIIEQRDK